LENSSRTKLALSVVINHAIADGGTIYNVSKMFDLKQPVVELEVKRTSNYDDLVTEHTSLLPTPNNFIESMNTILIPCLVEKASEVPPNVEIYNVNMEEIKERKAKHVAEHPGTFVSSNDILTAWMAEISPEIDYCQLIVTTRDRIPGVSDKNAGNYVMCPLLRTADFKSPYGIRKALNRFVQPGNPWKSYTKEGLQKYLGGTHTNWARFYHQIEVPGYTQKFHMPAVDPYMKLPDGRIVASGVTVITFVPNKGELASMIITRRPEFNTAVLGKTPMLRGQLLPF